jgi:Holliday junction DNA helicase RuvA
MIGHLQGQLSAKTPPQIVLDCQGVGYEVDVPMSTFYNLPNIGQTIRLLTHLVVREDAHLLYGFGTEAERALFRQLIKISGIGPRMALGLLSGMSVADIAQAVALQEASRLVKVPGIGKKTAERLLLELKGKLTTDLGQAVGFASSSGAHQDVLQALLALGYSEKEASLAVRQLPADASVSAGIKTALRALS